MSWSLLSPVQWAKWTWSAVRGGTEEEGEEMREEEEGETKVEEELFPNEDRRVPRSGSSDSEGHFGTPEVQTPVNAPPKELVELEDPNANGTAGLPEGVGQLILPLEGCTTSWTRTPIGMRPTPRPPPADASGEDVDEREWSVDMLNNLTDARQLQAVPPIARKPSGDASVMAEGVAAALQGQPRNGHTEEAEPMPIPEKIRPLPLSLRGSLNRANLNKAEPPSDDDIEMPVPKACYGFDPDQYDDNFNPFSSGGSKLQNSPPPCPRPTATKEDPTATWEDPASTWEDPTTVQDDPVAMQEYSTTTWECSTAAREIPTATQEVPTTTLEDPVASWEDPTTTLEDPVASWEDPTTTQEYPTSAQGDPTANQKDPDTDTECPTTTQEDPPAILEDPPTIREDPPAIREDPPAIREDPPAIREDPPTIREDPPAIREDPPAIREDPPAIREDPPAIREDPPAIREDPIGAREDPAATQEDAASQEAKPVKMEFGLMNEGSGGETKRPPPRKLGKKPGSKLLAPRTQRPKPVQPASAPAATHSSDDAPAPKSSYGCDPSEWDDPNFNPFGTKGKMSNSPTLPKGSYSFNPDRLDDSVDPFKPSKSLAEDNTAKVAPPAEKLADEPAKHKLDLPLEDEERKCRQSPKKTKSRMITTTEQVKFLCFLLNACKVEKYENQSLVLDVCDQEEDPVVTQAPSMSHRVSRATDEEKLASTAKGETESEPPERPAPPASPAAKTKTPHGDESQMKMADSLEEKDSCCLSEEPPATQSTEPRTGSESQETGSPLLNSICISQADKGAVLALIREEIIAKEIEAGQWKRKYEQTRQEVLEMRQIVAEYETTVAQMIEDEHRTNRTSQRTIQQLTAERDQALADLNSVERSISDLFRRYENMKTILEGFKKNEEVLKKCAQEYLVRVKQEEQRYQTLKLHAEEKMDSANEEIALVRSKANSESIALNASLRKEQMRVESLEQALHQKSGEIEELTKICDELIAKLGKTD
ncbi:LOW QUALITY PROTEIN: transforming acidic coiled-coil-containing protein 1-like [Anguilla anguilla]|uniref:LOW QUALITY PROTEIN: transforming acidic coiled-coil-containing protein 1-like n=1 Tax=Anguilla anguilla TaxID=7936 RepID=UPI0015AF0D7C|nr:LOW QUALITY PROTEIN: transforming acidic coiled-coil-containing protein 1-like [Anguilla anguilla]